MAKTSCVLLTVVLASALSYAQAPAQTLQSPQLDLAAPFVGSPLTCSQTQKLVISKPFVERAKLKARLLDLLRESLYDDAKGVVNVAREKEIKSLARKLRDDNLR